jgi:hypothetical protein
MRFKKSCSVFFLGIILGIFSNSFAQSISKNAQMYSPQIGLLFSATPDQNKIHIALNIKEIITIKKLEVTLRYSDYTRDVIEGTLKTLCDQILAGCIIKQPEKTIILRFTFLTPFSCADTSFASIEYISMNGDLQVIGKEVTIDRAQATKIDSTVVDLSIISLGVITTMPSAIRSLCPFFIYHNVIYFNKPGNDPLTLSIRAANGRCVFENYSITGSKSMMLTVTGLAPGTYFATYSTTRKSPFQSGMAGRVKLCIR